VDCSPVRLSVEDGLATVRLDREHGNAIDPGMVDGLQAVFSELGDDPAVRGVLLAASGKLFCPGLDLQVLIDYDRPRMREFMERFGAATLTLYALPKPMVAAISGHALAGGCLLALTADRRILRRGALVGLNEVRIGVPLPYGQALMLREAVVPFRLEEIALDGRNFSDEEALAAGIVHEVHPEEGFEERCRERLLDLASRDPLAYAATKRYLRSAAVERIRTNDARLREEFLDCWFSEGARRRIAEVVASLRASRADRG
jgi:enoyl-CoA hydratase